MRHLVISPRAIQVVNKSIDLFHHHGFHTVGIDKIVKESQIPKATFYHYFHSKELFIEICMTVQKERLKEKVVSIVDYDQGTGVRDKLKTLYLLHTDLEGPYYLLFKAIFETKLTYPKAYQIAVRYRTWLINELYSQLRLLKIEASFNDAKILLYMIEGAIIQLLSSDKTGEREMILECFLKQFKAA
ncbi:TetR/AcrR family transcriptional regulator [Acinetobacter oleivorans]|uniref:TetR/AcrR family transcriptional regulator n=1 Tax=Acinetobacter oleivorans TaxID=1148157 RepID=UPI0011A8271C|nr:TetR/AcrR family transcriptional regulator [Acinetobacter oleivorans]